LASTAHADSVRFTVDDTGPGVPPELRDRVFQKFFRVPGTTKQGSGLGLSIVDDIVAHTAVPWGRHFVARRRAFLVFDPLEPQAPLT
jgi:K+-sensing histidine kinase KdpD